MINIKTENKRIYIEISGNISGEEAREFFNEYRNIIQAINPRHYTLILPVSEFHMEKEQYLRDAVMMFFRTGFRKIYLVDRDGYVMKNLRLSFFERKIFFRNITVVKDLNEIP